jgi:ankyrin repeat protein
MNAGNCSLEHLKRIYDTLLKRGVDCKAKDSYQRTALHYSVLSNSIELLKMLLQVGEYDPNH